MKFKSAPCEMVKPSRRDLIIGGGAIALSPALPARRAKAQNKDSATPETPLGLSRVATSAGGYCLTVDVDWSGSGLRLVSVDTVGCYSYNGVRHTQLITKTSAPFLTGNIGYCADIRMAPSLITRWLAWVETSPSSGKFTLIATNNSGALWRETGLTCGGFANSEFGFRWASQRIAIDPNNPDVAFVSSLGSSSINKGVWRTDASGTVSSLGGWTKVTAIPDPNGGFGCAGIVFDVSGGTTTVNGKTVTKNIIIPSFDNGVWLSVDGGLRWTQISDGNVFGLGGPRFVNSGEVFRSGAYAGWYWCTQSSGGAEGKEVWKYKIGGKWTRVQLVGPPYAVTRDLPGNYAALNQNRSGDIIFAGHAFYTARTLDNGDTFINNGQRGNLEGILTPVYMGQTKSTNNVTWLSIAKTPNQAPPYGTGDPCQAARDPLNADRIICATGAGIMYMDWPSSGSILQNQHYVVDSLGIEQLEVDMVIKPPGAPAVLLAVRDCGLIAPEPNNKMATTYYPARNFAHGYSIDYAKDDPSFCIGILFYPYGGAVTEIVKSTKYGSPGTWTQVVRIQTKLSGGYVACQTSTNFAWVTGGLVDPGNRGTPTLVHTTDGANFSASKGIPNNSWGTNPNTQWQLLCCDGANYYAYLPGVGTYKSDDATGANFKLQSGPLGGVGPSASFISIRSVPGRAGHLWLCSSGTGGGKLFRSTDGGRSWKNVTAFGWGETYLLATFGATAPGASYPRVVVMGNKARDNFGLYACDDGDAANPTFTPIFDIATMPTAWAPRSICVDGDEARIVYLAAGHPGFGAWQFRSAN